jgi:membrane-bound ClpP family serine protease
VFKVKIPIAVLIPLVIILGTFVFIVHRAIVPSLRRRNETGSEGMIGLSGEVTEALGPKGIIKVQNEYWQARCDNERIEVGEDVEITGIDRLILEVKRKA